jgi:hypothetical protein
MKNIFKFNHDKFTLLTVVGMAILFSQNNESNLMVRAEEITAIFVPKLIYDTLTPKVW